MTLQANGEAATDEDENVITVTLTAEDDWAEKTVEDLPKYAGGEEIEYTWSEDGLPEGYVLTNTETEDETNEDGVVIGTITTLTNSYTPETTEIKVTKVWDDDEDNDGLRPGSITVVLKAGEDEVATAILAEENGGHTRSRICRSTQRARRSFTRSTSSRWRAMKSRSASWKAMPRTATR